MHDDDLVALAVLSVETGVDVDVLGARLGDAVRHDQTGLRCVTSEAAKTFLDGHHAARQAAREQARLDAERLAVPNAARARVRWLKQTQHVDAANEPLLPGAALAAMREADGSRDHELDRAAEARRELLDGRTVYHRLGSED